MLKEPKTQMLKELIQCAKGLIVYIHIHTFMYMYTTVHVCVCAPVCVHRDLSMWMWSTCIKSTCITRNYKYITICIICQYYRYHL